MTGLRGPSLFPTTFKRWAVENGYLPPGEIGVDWDPQRLPAGLKSRETKLNTEAVCKLLQARWPDQRIEQFTEAQLVEFLLESTGPNGARWAPETVAVRMGRLRAVFSWAHWKGLIPVDPSAHLRRLVKVKRQGVTPHNWLTKEDVQGVLATCDLGTIGGRRDRVALELGFGTGLRVSEMIGLSWDQVRLSAGTLAVVGKGGRPATQPMPPGLVGLLRAWKQETEEGLGAAVLRQPVVCPTMSTGFPHNAVVGRWGRQMGETTWRSLVKAHGAPVGWPTLAPHDLRRSYAGLLEANGVPIHEISRLLRHSNVATTERYLADNPAKAAKHVAGDLW